MRFICDICGKHFYYDVYAKQTYKDAEQKYFEHYKKEHNIDIAG